VLYIYILEDVRRDMGVSRDQCRTNPELPETFFSSNQTCTFEEKQGVEACKMESSSYIARIGIFLVMVCRGMREGFTPGAPFPALRRRASEGQGGRNLDRTSLYRHSSQS